MSRECEMVLIQGGAEFDDALAGGFYGDREVGGSGFVEEQDDAIEFAFAGAAGESRGARFEKARGRGYPGLFSFCRSVRESDRWSVAQDRVEARPVGEERRGQRNGTAWRENPLAREFPSHRNEKSNGVNFPVQCGLPTAGPIGRRRVHTRQIARGRDHRCAKHDAGGLRPRRRR